MCAGNDDYKHRYLDVIDGCNFEIVCQPCKTNIKIPLGDLLSVGIGASVSDATNQGQPGVAQFSVRGDFPGAPSRFHLILRRVFVARLRATA